MEVKVKIEKTLHTDNDKVFYDKIQKILSNSIAEMNLAK